MHVSYSLWRICMLTNSCWFSLNLLKVLLEVLQAALQDADLIMVQLLERAAGSTQQADIVCSVSETFCNILVICLTNLYKRFLCPSFYILVHVCLFKDRQHLWFCYPPVTVFSPVSKKEFKIHFFKLLPKIIIGEKNATVSEFFVLDLSYDLSISFSDLDPPLTSQFLILHWKKIRFFSPILILKTNSYFNLIDKIS